PSITQRMLTNQLRELEGDGLITRKVYPEVPPKVEYRLSQYGQTLAPVIHALKAWGDAHIQGGARQAQGRQEARLRRPAPGAPCGRPAPASNGVRTLQCRRPA